MKTIILGDARLNFQKDISNNMMLDAYPLEVLPAKNFEEVCAQAGNYPNAFIVISDSMLAQYDSSRLSDRVVYGYVSSPNTISQMQEQGIQCMGLHKTSKSLLNALSQDNFNVMQPFHVEKQPTAPPMQTPPPVQQAVPVQQPSAAPVSPVQPSVATQAPPVQQPVMQQPFQPQQTPTANTVPPAGFTPEMMAFFQMFQQMQSAAQVPQAQQVQEAAQAAQTPQPTSEQPVQQPAPSTGGAELRQRRNQNVTQKSDEDIDEDILSDMVSKNKKTKVVAIYAAKGGVGKTSIATELATCLALTSNGRRRFRVCIVDYNIDFGDVATTLMLKEQGANMTYWASEIREMLDSGKDPKDITFDRKHMESYYLQKIEATGLYALAAPIMHEDSMFIKSEELEVMLDNLINYGEFDYIICDTGNNTRDSTVIAIDKADFVLLVATQDVTTANCNASVLRTLRDTGFDTDKVRLVLNNVMPSHETGISVQEVEETFPYECVCRIKNTRDIIRANNLGQPLVYKPNHEYTKQIQRIVKFVTQGEVTQEESKKGVFGRLFHRK